MQAVWGERWWMRRKRRLQNNLETRRRHEEEDRLADAKRIEGMRQRRIKRKMGACKYYFWPCGRAPYEKMFPRAEVHVVDPEAIEAERLRQVGGWFMVFRRAGRGGIMWHAKRQCRSMLLHFGSQCLAGLQQHQLSAAHVRVHDLGVVFGQSNVSNRPPSGRRQFSPQLSRWENPETTMWPNAPRESSRTVRVFSFQRVPAAATVSLFSHSDSMKQAAHTR